MAKTTPFDLRAERYDRWFDRHAAAYRSELLADMRRIEPVRPGRGSGAFVAARASKG